MGSKRRTRSKTQPWVRECVRLAQELLDSGRALAKLRDFIRLSREVAA